jgi:threonyl-tRNA synthetase
MISNEEEGKKVFKIRHSLTHILAAAVLKKFPKTKMTIGPVIENGFYYDMDFGEDVRETDNNDAVSRTKISDSDLKDFSKNMKKIISQNLDFSVEEISKEDALKKFSGNEYKIELIEDISKNGEKITIYKIGKVFELDVDGIFTDLCEGPHVENTSEINIKAFKLTKIAGAY